MNKHGIQQNLLVTQGVVTTVIALGYALIPDVSIFHSNNLTIKILITIFVNKFFTVFYRQEL